MTTMTDNLLKLAVFIAAAVIMFGCDLYFYEGYIEVHMMASSIAILAIMPFMTRWNFWQSAAIGGLYSSLLTILMHVTVEMMVAEKITQLMGF